MLFRSIFLYGICTFLVSCTTIKREKHTYKSIEFTGPIDTKSVENIIQSIKQPPKTDNIIINSGGGNELAALKLAKTISQHNVNVVVEGACISACAHIILPAARKVFIVEGSIIGFHGNIFGWLELFARTNQDEYSDLLENSANIAEFLDQKSINLDVLFCTANLTEPKTEIIYNSLNIPTRKTKYRFLVADQNKLDWYGVKAAYFTGYSPTHIKKQLAKSGVDLKGTLKDWTIEDCDALNMTTWKKVKKALRHYSSE